MPKIIPLLLCAAAMGAAPKRVLYVTHSAGFRHGSIETSIPVMQRLSPSIEVTATEDLSRITTAGLRDFDGLFFFTSGELDLSAEQKAALLEFVRGGKGFGGAHSATDTLYTWPEYGEMIGAVFDGHPWAQEVSIDVDDPYHPATRHLAPSFRISDEIYQFRSFSRERVNVLLKLDTRSVDPRAPGVNRTDGDFALTWTRAYGMGRVFYTALGHGDETWLDARFQTLLRQALLWLTGELPRPEIAPDGVVNAASFAAGAVAPGSLISLFGADLTTGSSATAPDGPLKLAGSSVLVNGASIPLMFASPGQINGRLPPGAVNGEIAVESATGRGTARPLRVEAAAPGIFSIAREGEILSIYATGLGGATPVVNVGSVRAEVRYAGPGPGPAGLDLVQAVIPAGTTGRVAVTLQVGEGRSNAVEVEI